MGKRVPVADNHIEPLGASHRDVQLLGVTVKETPKK